MDSDSSYVQMIAIGLSSHMPQLVHLSTRTPKFESQYPTELLAHHCRQYSPLLEGLDFFHPWSHEMYSLIPKFGPLCWLQIYNINPCCYPKDEDITTLAGGLPNLVYLELRIDEDLEGRPLYGVTFESIHGLAKHCKKLEQLRLAMDATDMNIHCPFEYRGPVFEVLKDIAFFPIGVSRNTANGVAYFIRAMAPMIAEFECAIMVFPKVTSSPNTEAIWITWDTETIPKVFIQVVRTGSLV